MNEIKMWEEFIDKIFSGDKTIEIRDRELKGIYRIKGTRKYIYLEPFYKGDMKSCLPFYNALGFNTRDEVESFLKEVYPNTSTFYLHRIIGHWEVRTI